MIVRAHTSENLQINKGRTFSFPVKSQRLCYKARQSKFKPNLYYLVSLLNMEVCKSVTVHVNQGVDRALNTNKGQQAYNHGVESVFPVRGVSTQSKNATKRHGFSTAPLRFLKENGNCLMKKADWEK